jgi:hypothetical protein
MGAYKLYFAFIKNPMKAGHLWFMPVIPVTWEAEIGRTEAQVAVAQAAECPALQVQISEFKPHSCKKKRERERILQLSVGFRSVMLIKLEEK